MPEAGADVARWILDGGAITAIILAIEAIGFLCALDSVMRARTPQGSIAWALALVFLPIVSVPLYMAFGQRRFDGKVLAHRRGRHALDRRVGEVTRATAALHSLDPALVSLAPLYRVPPTRGNDCELLIDGKATFDAIERAIDAAERCIAFQFYIIRDDRLGRRMAAALARARARGVRVMVLYDAIGSMHLAEGWCDRLRADGVEVRAFRTSRTALPININFRNHRKVVIVDGGVAFLGGLNVGDEYMGQSPAFGSWRDTHVRIAGPAALAVQLSFAEDWRWATGEELTSVDWAVPPERGDDHVAILPTGPADELESCSLMYLHLISRAQRRLWVASPYFVPDQATFAALQLAALRGVDVRVIMPLKPDNVLVRMSALTFIPEALAAGIKAYSHTVGFMHQKVMLSDDLACVGTANLDNRSLRINFEISALAHGGTLSKQVEAMFHSDFEGCHGIGARAWSGRSWIYRGACRAARLMAPIQ